MLSAESVAFIIVKNVLGEKAELQILVKTPIFLVVLVIVNILKSIKHFFVFVVSVLNDFIDEETNVVLASILLIVCVVVLASLAVATVVDRRRRRKEEVLKQNVELIKFSKLSKSYISILY